MRKYLLDCLDVELTTEEQVVGHLCCSNCSLVCDCVDCTTIVYEFSIESDTICHFG
jgi:hypothetical protein